MTRMMIKRISPPIPIYIVFLHVLVPN